MVRDFHDASLRTLSLSCRHDIRNIKQHRMEGEDLKEWGSVVSVESVECDKCELSMFTCTA